MGMIGHILVPTLALVPHGFCLLWNPVLVWLYAISDASIAVAYYSIPMVLVTVARRRRDIAFGWVFLLFAAFILACGTTHLMSVVTLWLPFYRLDVAIKLVTAILSVVTAALLWPLLPRALALPSPAQLQQANRDLATQIVERERAQEALRDSERRLSEIERQRTIGQMEERFRRVVEAAPNAMVMANASGTIEMVNAQAERLFRASRADLLGRQIDSLVPERFRTQHPRLRSDFLATPTSRSMGAERELYALRTDGTEFPVEIGLNPIETDEGTMVLSAIVDISDRKQEEARIRASLREKDMLLGEIHHRVKNNLQVICSLLDLQSVNVSEPVVLDMLRASQNRIRSMALIHQTLYQSHDFSQVDFRRFLETLCPMLIDSYHPEASSVKLALNTADVVLPIRTAVPCGLIVNELVSNALRHGFPNGEAGEIKIDLVPAGGGYVSLSVADNGRGIPEEQDLEHATTLGLQMVTLLSRQVRGKLSIRRADPTRFTVLVPLEAAE